MPPFDDDTLAGDDNNGTSSLFPSLLFPSYAPSYAPSSLVVVPGQEEGADLVTLTFGLFVFLNITSNECVFYQYNSISDLSVYQNIGRLGITVAMICSLIAGTVLLLEYSFCRIPCSRVFINTGYALAICGVPLTFVVFLIDRCRQNNTSGGQDGCTMGRGGLYALIALIAFFITLVMTCVVPKSIPLVKILQRWAVNDDTGGFGCLCWRRAGKGVWHFTGRLWWCGGGRRQQNKGTKSPTDGDANGDDGDDDEGVPLAGGFSADDLIVDENGHTYKQYHDERAGYTLQNQYTGAYRRWLAFGEDYDVALARFKEACLEADVNWRVFLRKSKERRRRLRGQIQQQAQQAQQQQQQALVVASPSGYPASVGAGSLTVATNPGASFYQLEEAAAAASAAASAADAESAIFPWNNGGGDDRTIATEGAFQDELYGGDEDDIYLDDELLRNVDVLVTLQANCDFARDVMNRIQQDINDHARQEDVLHQQLLERQQLQKQKMEEKKRKKKKQEEEDKKAKAAAAAASANANRWMTSRRTQQGQDNKDDDEGEASPFLDNTNRRMVASNRPDTPSSQPPPQIEYNEDPTADPTAAPPEGFEAAEDGNMYASARMMEATASRTTYRIDRDGDLFASARMEPRAPILPTSARSRLHGTIPTLTPTPSSGQPGEVTTPRDDEMSPHGGADGNGNNTVTQRVARPVAKFFKAVPKRANQAWDKVVTRRKDRSNDDDDDKEDDELNAYNRD